MTVVELVAAYWRFVKRHYVKGGNATSEQYAIAAALRPLKAIYGHTRAADLGPLGLKTVRDRMVSEHGWARGTVNDNVSRIRRNVQMGGQRAAYSRIGLAFARNGRWTSQGQDRRPAKPRGSARWPMPWSMPRCRF